MSVSAGPGRGQAFVLLAVSSLTVMAGAVVSPSLPGIEAAFSDLEDAGLLARMLLTIPALSIALAAPFAGYVVDRFGRRGTLQAGLIIFALAGASGLVLQSMVALLVGRVVLGIGIAAIMTSATTLIADLYDGAARGRLLGWQAAFMGLGGTTFLLSGGALADVSWRAPFGLYLVALPLLPALWAWVSEPSRDGSPGVSPTEPHENGGSVDTARVPEWAVFVAIYGLSFAAMVAFYLIPVQGPFLLTARFQANGLGIGAAMATMTLLSVVGSLVAPRILGPAGHAGTSAVTFATLGGGLLLMSQATGWTVVLVGMALAGLGLGIVMPNMAMWVTRLAPQRSRGRLLGGLTTALFAGQFASPFVVAPLVGAQGDGGMAFLVIGAGGVAVAAGCLGVTFLRRAPQRNAAGAEA